MIVRLVRRLNTPTDGHGYTSRMSSNLYGVICWTITTSGAVGLRSECGFRFRRPKPFTKITRHDPAYPGFDSKAARAKKIGYRMLCHITKSSPGIDRRGGEKAHTSNSRQTIPGSINAGMQKEVKQTGNSRNKCSLPE